MKNLVVWLMGEYEGEAFHLKDLIGRTVFSYDCSKDAVYPVHASDIKVSPSISELFARDGALHIRRKKMDDSGSVNMYENTIYNGYFRCGIQTDEYENWKLMTIRAKYQKGIYSTIDECELLMQKIGISHITMLDYIRNDPSMNKDGIVNFCGNELRVPTLTRDIDFEKREILLSEVWSNHLFDTHFVTEKINNRLVVQQTYRIYDRPDTWILRMRNAKMVLYAGALYDNPYMMHRLLTTIYQMKLDGYGIGTFEGSFFGINYEYTIRYFPYIWLPEDREKRLAYSRRMEAIAKTYTYTWPGYWTDGFRFTNDGTITRANTHSRHREDM